MNVWVGIIGAGLDCLLGMDFMVAAGGPSGLRDERLGRYHWSRSGLLVRNGFHGCCRW
ncbi:hypothetical protein PF005_g26174 [Phytophthora fragariae]|uniref:Uncharacterized protein n=1 Tax=Phytophthora fragariae TaxID=53985 RepID=A0A6A3DU74_9STRA|nr:hypothetical protein PF003_g2751 [Phytophthora fragariae]KAE8922821.1 hypothetical protein PF009_g26919 [Phytophthora fragariae]KAE9075049.1 hypothetical protein PF007_g25152 [Phytophthora fragariae]KAE9100881.1 hypothetical protein PF006_g22802 [Phytophthora fragariae]KAE9173664.1 hypothetical protein PF005_g26174 [Phytophthora fragariae]